MPMDPYELAMGYTIPEDEQLRQTAEALRGRNTFGQAMTMSGLGSAEKAGRGMMMQSAREAEQVGQQRRHMETNALKETLASMKAAAKGTDFKKMTTTMQKDLTSLGGDMDFLDGAVRSFDDSITRPAFGDLPGPQNELTLLAARHGMGTDEAKKSEQWWANWSHNFTIKFRNAMFGATLTDNEEAAWKAANEINSDMDPEQIRTRIKNLQRELNKKSHKLVSGLTAGDYNKEEAVGFLGRDPIALQAEVEAAAAGAEAEGGAEVTKTINGVTYIQKDGQWYEAGN